MSLKKVLLKLCPPSLRKPAFEVVKCFRKIRYRGDMLLNPRKMTLYCPCCGYRFRAFNGSDFKERHDRYNPKRYEGISQDVLCPICRALPRHRILALWCEEHIKELADADILYFAPERSMMKWMHRKGIS